MKKIIILLFLAISCNFVACNNDQGSSEISTPTDGKGGSLAVFALKGDYLYTVDFNSLNVFHIKNIENPVLVNKINTGRAIETLFSLDNYLFIGSQNAMYIYDISSPENPVFKSQSNHLNACDPVVATQNYAFVTLHSNSECGNDTNLLKIYDISDIENPVLIHSRGLVSPKGLTLYNDQYLVVCDDELKIFNIENPEEPFLVKSINQSFKDVLIYNETLFAFGQQRLSQFKWTGDDFLTLHEVSNLNY